MPSQKRLPSIPYLFALLNAVSFADVWATARTWSPVPHIVGMLSSTAMLTELSIPGTPRNGTTKTIPSRHTILSEPQGSKIVVYVPLNRTSRYTENSMITT
jgi:hypothetical protein